MSSVNFTPWGKPKYGSLVCLYKRRLTWNNISDNIQFWAGTNGIFIWTFSGAVIAMLREHKGDYGLQRIYASIGGMISSPLSGMLIDYASENKGYTDFRYDLLY